MPDSASGTRAGSSLERQRPWGLSHAADRRSVATVALTVGLLLVPLWWAPSGPWAAAWIAAACIACCASHVVVHNHCHRPIFASHTANRIFNLFASVARGHCASDVCLPHNVNHHAEQGRARDWIRPGLGGNGHPAWCLCRYVVRATFSMARERRRLGPIARTLVPEPFRSSLRWEKVLLPGVVLALLGLDWRTAALHVFVPWGGSLIWLVGVNYVQHEGCDPDSEWAHSRNFTGRITNWLLFNNGYHAVHHAWPGLHWSETKACHERFASCMPGHLQEPSALRYMVRRFLAGRRG